MNNEPANGIESPGGKPLSKFGLVIKVAITLAVIVALFVLGRKLGAYVPGFVAWVEGLGAWGPIVFMAGYAVATVAFIPGSALTLAAGAIFGIVKGTLFAFSGAWVGAGLAFLVARYGARRRIEGRLADKPKFAAIDRAVGKDGGKIVALLRLSPVFPFNLLYYALGLTSVRFVPYLLANFAMIPGTLLYVYYGKLAGDVAQASAGSSSKSLADWVVMIVGLAATVLVTVIITKKARRALNEAAV